MGLHVIWNSGRGAGDDRVPGGSPEHLPGFPEVLTAGDAQLTKLQLASLPAAWSQKGGWCSVSGKGQSHYKAVIRFLVCVRFSRVWLMGAS